MAEVVEVGLEGAVTQSHFLMFLLLCIGVPASSTSILSKQANATFSYTCSIPSPLSLVRAEHLSCLRFPVMSGQGW